MLEKGFELRNKIFFVMMFMLLLLAFLVMFFGYFTYRAYKNPFAKLNIHYLGGLPFEGDDEIGYVSVKNASIVEVSEGGNYHIYSDKRRARASSKDYQTPSSVDIITLGCSFAYGYRVENKYTFTEKLGREFNVSVANFALCGYGTVQSLQMLKRNIDLRPKVVIYAFITDHIRRNLSSVVLNNSPFCRIVSFIDFNENKEPFIHPPRFELLDPKLFNKFEEEILYSKEGFGLNDVLWRARTDLYHLKEWRNIQYPNDPLSRKASLAYLINEMSATVNRIGAKLIIVYLPHFGKGHIEPPPEELLTSLNDDILFMDMSPKLTEYYKNENSSSLTIPGDYAHPGQLGHALIAQELQTLIEKENLLKMAVASHK